MARDATQGQGKAGGAVMKAVRVITVPPVLALAALVLMYCLQPAFFGGMVNLILSIVFICVLPVSGYVLQPLIPAYKNKGREGQRRLAMLTAVAGYLAGNVYAAIAGVPAPLWWVYLTYLLSGVLILVFNKLVRVRASGHACGVAGPVMLVAYAFGPWALAGFALLALVFYVSIKMKRHTMPQLVLGALLSTAATLLSALVFRLPPWFAVQ